MGQDKETKDSLRLITKFQSAESSSRITEVFISKINSEKKWKVIGFLKSLKLNPVFERASDNQNTVISLEVTNDKSKDFICKQIFSFVRSLGINEVSVSYSSRHSESQDSDSESGECEEFVDESGLELVNSEDIERIARKIEDGFHSEFELIVSEPEHHDKKNVVAKGHKSRNLIASIATPCEVEEIRHSDIWQGMILVTSKSTKKCSGFVNEVSTQTKKRSGTSRKEFPRRLLTSFKRIKNLRYKHIKRFCSANWEKIRTIAETFKRSNRVSSCDYCRVRKENHRDKICGSRDIRQSSVRSENHKLAANTYQNDEKLTVATYTQTESFLQEFLYHKEIKERKNDLKPNKDNKYRKYLSNQHKSLKINNKDVKKCRKPENDHLEKCRSKGCARNSKVDISHDYSSVMNFTRNILPLLQKGDNPPMQPIYYVVPAGKTRLHSSTLTKNRDECFSSEFENGSISSPSTTYSSLSSVNSSLQEKTSKKEKKILYIRKDMSGSTSKCQTKKKSVKQIKVINQCKSSAKDPPKVTVNKSSKMYQPYIRDEDVDLEKSTNIIEKQKELENIFYYQNIVNRDKLFQEQLQELNKKLDMISSLRMNKINESVQCIVEDLEKINATDMGICTKQLVDMAVECGTRVDAFSECTTTENVHKSENNTKVALSESSQDQKLILNKEKMNYRSYGNAEILPESIIKRPKCELASGSPYRERPYLSKYWTNANEFRPLKRKRSFGSNCHMDSSSNYSKKKKKGNTCPLLSSLLSRMNTSHKEELLRHEEEIIRLKQLFLDINTGINREHTTHGSQYDDDDDSDEEDINIWFSRPSHLAKSVSFRNPLID